MSKVAETIQAPSSNTRSNSTFFTKRGGDFLSRKPDIDSPFFSSAKTSFPVQTKLNIGQPNDKYEREADAVADMVVQKPNQPVTIHGESISPVMPSVQTKCAECEKEDKLQKKEESNTEENISFLVKESAAFPDPPSQNNNNSSSIVAVQLKGIPGSIVQAKPIFESEIEQKVQRKCEACEKEERLQMQGESASGKSELSAIETKLAASKGNGAPVSPEIRKTMETKIGADFSKVRVHTDQNAVQMNRQLHAQAFTHGNDIYFNANKFNTNSREGHHLLAHELTHTVQQGASPETPRLQKYSWDDFTSDVDGAASTVSNGLSNAAGAVVDTASRVGSAVYDTGAAVVDTVTDAASAAVSWLETEAGQLAQALADATGGMIRITSAGLEIHIPGGCPLDALTHEFKLKAISKDWMVPIFELPIPPDILINGEVGLKISITPEIQLQVGPVCFDDTVIIVNPITSNYSISGGMSITTATSVGAEIRGGLKGAISVEVIIPIGGVPVPIKIPAVSVEGGPAVLFRAIGAQTFHTGGMLSYSGGVITARPDLMLDSGLAADLYAGAYAELDVLGKNLCRIYWQPYQWHGGIASSIGISGNISWSPGSSAPSLSVRPPTLDQIPFDDIPLAINRHGFKDDCPIITEICDILRMFKLLPSQNGGNWDWSATGRGGTYGPGTRLGGPLDVYEKNPLIPSGSECRGACGPNCDTCQPYPTYIYVDPSNGDVWEYTDFQDCNSNDGCRKHDAAFDWAADVHGERGTFAIIMPWHMAANIECACNNLAGNCVAWIAGLPPYDMKMYFASSATKISSGTPVSPIPHGGGGGTLLPSDHPIGEVGPDFYHYSATPPSGDFRAGIERWTDYLTNCQAEAEAATGVGGHRYVTTLPNAIADTYIDRGRYTTRPRMSVIHGIVYPYNHYTNHTVIPAPNYTTTSLTIFTPNCRMGSSGAPTTSGNEEEDLDRCDRHELPPDYCGELHNRVIERFGNRERNLNFNPDTDVDESRRREDDTPASTRFRLLYNRLDSWDIYVRNRHADWYPEFDGRFHLNQNRGEWMDELKQRTKKFKAQFRDLRTQDTARLSRDFENQVLREMETRIDNLNHEIAKWYLGKTGSTESINDIIERVHREGTEIWRAEWRDSILAVNRILSRLWPPAKQQIQNWVGVQRGLHPGEDLIGSIGDIDYVGSLATGYKGAPKQYARFNPESFDVDANIVAPPLSKFAMNIVGILPDRQRIFAVAQNTTITPLITFCHDAHRELSSVHGYKVDDPFDTVIQAPETPGQSRSRTSTERVYALRATLSEPRYNQMVNDLRAAGLLIDEAEGWQVKPVMSRTEIQRFNNILAEYE